MTSEVHDVQVSNCSTYFAVAKAHSNLRPCPNLRYLRSKWRERSGTDGDLTWVWLILWYNTTVSIQNFVWTPSPQNLALEPFMGISNQQIIFRNQFCLTCILFRSYLYNRRQSQASSQNVSKVSSRALRNHAPGSLLMKGRWKMEGKKILLYGPPPNSPIDSAIDVLSSHVTAAPLHSPWHVRQPLLLHSSH